MDEPDDAPTSGATAALPPDRITLRDHVREAEVGAFGPERGRRQRLRFDVVCDVAPAREAVADDDVDGVLSYDTLLDAIDAALAHGHVALLETLAERIAAEVLRHPGAGRAWVRIEKLDLGPHRLGVEIARAPDAVRTRGEQAYLAVAPRVVLLPAGARDDPALLDGFVRGPAPVLLVATPDFAPPPCPEPAAARRIALLALEQAAWQLSAAAPGFALAGSRTELDALLRGQAPVVWAAPRMALDAADAPEVVTSASVARWLARTLGADDPGAA